MHRARHCSVTSVVNRHRALILAAVAAMGLGLALWLPTRYDNASAAENARDRQHAQDGHWRDRGRHGRARWRGLFPAPSPSDSASPPSRSDSASPPSESPSPAPTETSAPPASPSLKRRPAVTAWAPFTNYVAGRLVTFHGVTYEVQQTHTSLPGWEPPKIHDLFKVV
jgi:hypothetical protein